MIIERLILSPGHNFVGHHGRPAGQHAALEVDAVECVAGRGLRGDRFFDHQPDYKGQVTLFDSEVLAELGRVCQRIIDPALLRRNIVVRGADLNRLIGVDFELQGVALRGVEECRPCYWMDRVLGPGAEAWLRGRGGLRCRILTTGWLRRAADESGIGVSDPIRPARGRASSISLVSMREPGRPRPGWSHVDLHPGVNSTAVGLRRERATP